VVAKTLALYLGMLAFPAHFCLDRRLAVPVLPPEAAPLLAFAAISLVFAAAFRGLVRRRPWGAALALALLPLLPASNIVFLSGRPLSEGRLYLATAGFCLGIALFVDRAAHRPAARRLAAALAALLAAVWLVASAARTGYWLDDRVLWERTLEASPLSWRTKLFLSRIYSREGRPDEAIVLIKGILRYSEPRPPMAFVDLGLAYDALGWKARARAAFERAAAADPDNPAARLRLGEAYRGEGRFDEALREFEAVGRLRPDSERGLLAAAGVFSARGDHAAALDALRKVIARHPDSVGALAAAAAAHAALGEDAEAERLFAEARSLDPSSSAVLNNLGLFRERQGRLEEALALYMEASRAGPDRWAPRYNAAVILEAQGRPADALVAVMEAAALQPGHTGLGREVGRLLDSLKHTRLDPGAWERIAGAHAALLRVRGIYCARTGDADEAIECFEALIALDPRDGGARTNLARMLAERGEHRRALEEYRAAARLLPDSVAVQAGMGACYAELGMRGEAEAAWARALRLDPHAREPRRNLSRLRRLR
jgi:tetratricopeptide (TPR) repeat protein